MKRLLITALIFLSVLMLSTNTMAAKSKPTGVKHVFGVHGMSCPFCVIGIKNVFKKVKGVKSTEVSLKSKTVTVYTDKGICFSKKELKRLFGKAGFSHHGTMVQPKSCKQTK